MEQRTVGLGWLAAVLGLTLLMGGLAGGLAGGLVITYLLREQEGAFAKGETPVAVGVAPAAMVTEGSAVVQAVKQVGPAVVTVVNELAPRTGYYGPTSEETVEGSGVIIDPRGYIVTNEQVVRDNQGLYIILFDGEERPAQLVGTDYPFTDLAVIKTQPQGLSVATLGDSDALVVGQSVVAIGSTLGDYRNTTTVGVVSGLHRSWRADGLVMEDLIQTDAAINYGNSGGALATLAGQVVGINTLVIRTTETGQTVEGVGFAIPSNTVRLIVQEITQYGKVRRPFLGVSHREVTPLIASIYDLPVKYGAYVSRVSPGSPAHKGGINEGDIIVQVGADRIDQNHPFLNILMRHKPGEEVEVRVYREDREITLRVVLMERQ